MDPDEWFGIYLCDDDSFILEYEDKHCEFDVQFDLAEAIQLRDRLNYLIMKFNEKHKMHPSLEFPHANVPKSKRIRDIPKPKYEKNII